MIMMIVILRQTLFVERRHVPDVLNDFFRMAEITRSAAMLTQYVCHISSFWVSAQSEIDFTIRNGQ